MNDQLEDQLYQKYPKILAGMKLSPRESCMAFGLEVGDGWYQILDVLFNAIDHPWSTGVMIDDVYYQHQCPQVVADQCKEKMSSLRLYFHLESTPAIDIIRSKSETVADKIFDDFQHYVDGAVGMAESMSMITCEVTGLPGELVHRNGSPHGWMKVLSPAEAVKQGYAKVEWPKEEVTAEEVYNDTQQLKEAAKPQ